MLSNGPMPQLIVRNIEAQVVSKLRQRAARRGVSMEEEHRRILREVLVHGGKKRRTLKEHLADMPDVGIDALFKRPPARMRRVRL